MIRTVEDLKNAQSQDKLNLPTHLQDEIEKKLALSLDDQDFELSYNQGQNETLRFERTIDQKEDPITSAELFEQGNLRIQVFENPNKVVVDAL